MTPNMHSLTLQGIIVLRQLIVLVGVRILRRDHFSRLQRFAFFAPHGTLAVTYSNIDNPVAHQPFRLQYAEAPSAGVMGRSWTEKKCMILTTVNRLLGLRR